MNELSRKAYIALGSNLDDPKQHVVTAFSDLRHMPETMVLQYSRLYQSKPLGPQNQPDFINAVVALETRLTPHVLLSELQNIEKKHGRKQIQRWGPRTLDLDILLYDTITLNDKDITIPHPELYKRDFVLIPLADIAPHLRLPNGKTVTEHIAMMVSVAN